MPAVESVGYIIQGFEGFVGDGFVGERPGAFGGLELGRISGNEKSIRRFSRPHNYG